MPKVTVSSETVSLPEKLYRDLEFARRLGSQKAKDVTKLSLVSTGISVTEMFSFVINMRQGLEIISQSEWQSICKNVTLITI